MSTDQQERFLRVSPQTMLVFLDETGQEHFADPRHPVFGLGGCALSAGPYFSLVAPAWRSLKSQHFGGTEGGLHAASINLENEEGIIALGKFFREQVFGRLAVALSDRAEVPESLEAYQLVAASLRSRLVDVIRHWNPVDHIALIVEASERGDILAKKYLDGFRYWREVEGKKLCVPLSRHFMPKHVAEPGLEIADFVMHAVGGRTRLRRNGKAVERADFRSVFDEVDQRLVSFMEISRVELQ